MSQTFLEVRNLVKIFGKLTALGFSNPTTIRRVVVLPQPLGPSRVTTSPCSSLNDASLNGASPTSLGRWRWPIFAMVALTAFSVTVVPDGAMRAKEPLVVLLCEVLPR
jgi:hypothetical protein